MRKKKTKEIVEEPIKEVEVKEEPVVEPKVEIEEYYMLRVGETLADVAKKFNLDENKLKELNGEVIGGNQIKLK